MSDRSIVTPESLNKLLADERLRLHVVGRALVRILDRQTESEKVQATTKEWNGIGFTKADAKQGTITAKYYMKHKTLSQWQVDLWTRPNVNNVPRIVKYWRQLNEEAQTRR